jgi:small redox-active disulfide protein 2
MARVTQIKVGRDQTGIFDLHDVFKEVDRDSSGLSDEEISDLLVRKLSGKNYIPPSAAPLYAAAFLHEFKKFRGESVPDDPLEYVEIKILGMGCPSCDRLEKDLTSLLEETGIEADLEHVRDAMEISQYGIIGSPALVINRKVKAAGSVPSRSRLKTLLLDAEAEIRQL